MKKLPLVEAADAIAMAVVLPLAPEVALAAVPATPESQHTDMDLHFFVGPTVIGRLVSSKLDQSWHVDLPAEADEQQRQMCWSTSKTFFSVRFSRRYRTTYRLHKTNDEKMKHILIHPSIYTVLALINGALDQWPPSKNHAKTQFFCVFYLPI